MSWNVSSGLQDKERFGMKKSAYLDEISKLSRVVICV